MELRDLEYFLACVETGNLSRAAAKLHVAQPTLSHAIARLEKDLGKQILHRPSNKRAPLQVTEAGTILCERARRAISEIDGIEDDLNELDGLLRGQIQLAGIQSLNSTLLPRVLAAFAQAFPQVEIQLHTHASDAIPERVRSGQEDLGIIATTPDKPLYGLNLHHLYQEDFVAIVRRDDGLAENQEIEVKELASRELLLVNPTSYTGSAINEACAQAGFKPKTRLVLESGEALRECVRAGLGMCILPRGYLLAQDDDLVAIALINPTPVRQVLAISNEQRALSKACLNFLTQLKKCATLM